ncbi:MAG: hypothetical protein H0W68_01580 [Gemmatimonadaceae bacterium]|nr:hypothetical protein [Gemmatimonadaceae bacterium]
MLSLSSLAGWEEAVLASIAGAHGTPDERDRQVERSGLYAEYPTIVHGYIELFGSDAALEALKRALFLVWHSALAMPVDSGIAALPVGIIRSVIDQLDAAVRRGTMDDELRWMLAWYYAEAPLVLELFGASATVMRAAELVPADAWRGARITATTMAVRGQMGRFWEALAGATERTP